MESKKTSISVKFTLIDFFNQFNFNAKTSHGVIDYRKKTDNRPHYIPALNMYAGRCFQIGNNKLAENIAIFSLKEVLTCLTCEKYGCKKGCYALKASRQYATAYNFRLLMSYLACNNTTLLESFIREDLDRIAKNKTVDTVRIHEAGDFVSQQYVDMWTRIVEDFAPRFDFYCYIKTAELFNFSGLMAAGCAVNNSVIDGGKNYGNDCELAIMKENNPALYICTYETDHELTCGKHGRGGCRACMKKNIDGVMNLRAFHDHGDDAKKGITA